MKRTGYGSGYQYDHDVAGGVALDQTGFPDAGRRVLPADRSRHGSAAQGEAGSVAGGAGRGTKLPGES